jgi:hypothetical protein
VLRKVLANIVEARTKRRPCSCHVLQGTPQILVNSGHVSSKPPPPPNLTPLPLPYPTQAMSQI